MKKTLPYPVSRFVLPAQLLEPVQQQQNRTPQAHCGGGFSNSQSPSHPLVHWQENTLSIVKVTPALQTQYKQPFPAVTGQAVIACAHTMGGRVIKKILLSLITLFVVVSSLMAQTSILPSGTGTSGDPYLITTLNNLYWVTQNTTAWTGKYFKQTADIYAANTSFWDSGKGFLPIGNSTVNFTGNYDGAGFVISYLFINRSTSSDINTGFVGFLGSGGVIQNLNMVNVDITGYTNVGGLIGNSLGATNKITNCSSSGTVTGSSSVGGLIGYDGNSPVKICYSTCNVSGGNSSGGFVGAVNTATFTDCYSTGNVTATSSANGVGAFCGSASASGYSFTRCFALGSITTSSTTNVQGFLGGPNGGALSNCFYNKDATSLTDSYATGATACALQDPASFSAYDFTNTWRINPKEKGGYPTLAWQGTTNYAVQPSGAGSSDSDPYLITSLANLYWIHRIPGTVNIYYKQTADIDASETNSWCGGQGWIPINWKNASAALTYNGQMFKISNLYINRTSTISDNQGLFGLVNKYIYFNNINLENVNITTKSSCTGALIGNVDMGSNISISWCSSSGTIVSGNNAGGLIGRFQCPFQNTYYLYSTCSVSAASSTTSNIGGLIGIINGDGQTLASSYARGAVAGYNYVGGLVGRIESSRSFDQIYLNMVYSTGAVTASSTPNGGLVGYINNATITNSYWDTQTSGQSSSAGGTGLTTAQAKTSSSYNTWDFVGTWGMSPGVNDGYPYFYGTPTIVSFSPTSAANGTTVTISGFNLLGATAVKFGGTAATSFTVVDAKTITAVVSTGTTGSVSVTTPGGTANKSGFTWLNVPAPSGLSYAASPISATYGVPISNASPTVTGTIDSYSINPALPGGLSLNTTSGIISGTPTTTSSQTDYTVTAKNIGGSTTATVRITIDKKTLTISGVNAANKNYDGGTTATLSGGTLNGIVGSDAVTISVGTGSFADKSIGIGKTVTATGYTLLGAASANYLLSVQPSGLTADITKKPLTITGVTAANKTYDATTTASLSGGTLVGVVVSESVTITAGSGTFADANKGNSKTVTAIGYGLGGTNAGNYTLSAQPTGITANITAKALTVTGATTADKVYDGTTAASVTGGTLVGIIGTETVTLTQSGTFASKNVGNSIAITSTSSLGGADAGNYTLTQPTLTARNITGKALTVTGATTSDKVYDGTTTALVTGGTLVGVVSPDVVTLTQSGTYADKNAGNSKAITSTSTLGGADAGNYTLTQPTLTARNITAKALTVTATGVNKVYDGNTTATVTLGDNRVPGDVLTTAYTAATFADKVKATGKAVSVSGISISGTDAGNYTFNTTASATANITAKTLTVTPSATDKVYDGSTSATATLGDDRVSGDVLTVAQTLATFANKNVGIGKTVTVSGISISGADAANYSVATSATTTANITAKTLAVTTTATDKVYDATTAATTTLLDDRVSGDVLTLSKTSSTFDDKNIGTGKTVTVSGISKSGTDAGNYTLGNVSATTTANITQKALTITASGINKQYDGNATATVNLSDNRVSGDVLTASYTTATFPNKLIGNTKAVSVSGISISGTDAGNYSFNTTASTTANITAKVLTITATGINKVYDQNTTATVSLSDNRVAGDVLTSTYTSATFNNKNAGIGKPVNVSGISISGADIGNYTFNTTASTVADITAKPLNVTATAANKVYDGNTIALVALADDRISGDVLTTANTAANFSDKNVDTEKTVDITGISISGADAVNYAVNESTTATADITYKILTITGTNGDKVYDGTTNATVTLTDNRVSGDDLTITYTTAKFPDKNVGTAKKVTVSGIAMSGDDVQNYMTNNTVKFNANITARPLTVEGVTAADKVYDATTVASLSGGTLSNVISGDDVNLSLGTGAFVDKTAGNSKPITTSGYSIAGASAGNYSLSQPTEVTAKISTKPVTIENILTANKVYDGTTVATLSVGTVSGVISGDVVTIVPGTGAFADKAKGTNKTVTASGYSLGGADGANYSLTAQPNAPNADITGILLTITGVTASDKVYDGTSVATLNGGTLVGLMLGDDVSIVAGTGEFSDKTAVANKTVTASGYAISGTDAPNYTLSAQPIVPNANITVASLTITGVTASNRVYDQTTAVTLNGGTLNGIIGSDVVTITDGTGTFANKTVGTGKTVTAVGYGLSGTDAPNYTLTAQPSGISADISQADLTISGVTANNKSYDASTTASLTTGTLNGIITGDVVDLVAGTGTFDDKNVGTGKTVTATGFALSGTDMPNYNLVAQPSGLTANITVASTALTITGVTASNKVYDGTTTATLSGGTLNGIISGDVVNITAGIGSFSSKTVGTGKSVTATSYALLGTDAGNYTLAAQPTVPNADITVSSLTITGVTASNRVYDRTTAATLNGGTLNGIIGSDVVTITAGSGTFADKAVETGKTVTAVGYGITGADAANYSLSAQPTGILADITQATLTISGSVANNKMYDATTTAVISGGTLSGIIGADVVTFSGTGTFADKTADTGKTVTATGYTLGGSDGANYKLDPLPTGLTADITVAPISITGITVSDKVYDRTTAATLSEGILSGILGTDDVTIVAGMGAFSNKKVGTDKSVIVIGFSIEGTDAANYELTSQPAGLKASITAKALTLSGVTASNKVYDATTSAILSGGTLSGVIGADVVTLAQGTGTFADKTVGVAKVVTATGYGLAGADATNYTISQPSALTADIMSASVTITGVTVINKLYDGTTVATLNGGTLNGVKNGDVVSITDGTGSFADSSVGNGKTVTAIGYSLSGADASNYSLSAQPVVPNANITASPQTITFTALAAKTYGDAAFELSATSSSGLAISYTSENTSVATISGTTVTIVGAGTSKITASQAGNNSYSEATPVDQTLTIDKKPLTITSVTAANKVYDATTVATLSGGTLNGIVGTEVVTITAGTGSFADKTVATGKPVTATGYTIGGADASKYILSTQPSGITADITSAPVTISGVTAISKVYDATTVATLNGGTIDGKITGDDLSITAGTGSFSDKKVGTTKPVTATDYTLSGTDAANYSLTAQPSGMTADITVATIDINGITASNKVYDGTTTATLNSGSMAGVLGTDVVTLTAGSALFADKNTGTAIAVTASGFSLSGADATNYVLSGQPSGLTANITPVSLTITGVTAVNKVYDAITSATLSGGILNGIVGTEVVTITAGTGSFASKTVGTAKPVTATGYAIGGADAANYILSAQPSGLTADITTAPVTITGVTATSKVYDATIVATLNGGAIDGKITGDDLSITAGTGSFADKKVGTTKPVTATGYALSGTDAENYTLTAQPAGLTADISEATIDISGATANNKVYDGTTAATMNSGSMSGVQGSDVVSLQVGSASFADKNIGTAIPVTASGFNLAGADASNYVLSGQPSGLTANITSVSLTITGVTAANKVYDASTTAALSGGTLSGVITGDVVTITNGTGAFADKLVGNTKAVTATGYDISGADAGNYTLSGQPTGLTADITAAPVTITGVTASNKVYDATSTAALSGGTLSGVITGDVVTITDGTGAFADKNVNTAKPVTAKDYAISGADAGNYTLIGQPTGLTADITAVTLDITGVTASNKVYDGTTAATLNSGSLTGILSSDDVTLSAGSASFAEKSVGTAKQVTASGFSLSGTDAANYVLSGQPSGLTANITVASVDITGVTAANKVYDALTTATLNGGTLSGVVSGDVVTITDGTGTFAEKTVGTAKPVTAIGYAITGADASNYTLSAQPSGLTADITSASVTITGVTASNKVYDAANSATLTGGTLSGVISGDLVSITDGTGSFENKTVGIGKSVTATGYAISGTDASNYTLSAQPSGLTADITAVTLDISGVTASNKVYDGTTTATMNTGSLTGILSSDNLTLTAGAANFADKSVGTAKPVTASGFSLIGTDAGNYVLSGQPSGLTANITKAPVTITGVTATNKVYDATATATLSGGTLSGVVTGDVVTITNGTGAFADKNAGISKAVTATGYDISGADAGNYTLSGQPTGLTADITAAPVTITGVTASSKVYDATATAVLSGGTLSGVITGDVVTITDGTGAFANKNAGNTKAVTAIGYSISGTDAGNYTLLAQPFVASADITAVTLDITGVTANNKVYDGTSAATINSGSLSGVLGSDVIILSAGLASFADKSIGNTKAVSASGFSLSGADAGNYILSGQPSGLTANITAAPVGITGVTAANKVYDATSVATLSGGTVSGLITGDVVSITNGTGVFANKNVGIAKAVTATGYAISGTDAGNYVLSGQPTGLTANITPAPVSFDVVPMYKYYDGGTTAVLAVGPLTGIKSGDAVTLTDGTGIFSDKNVGRNKTVAVTGFGLAGADALNYTLSAPPSGLTTDIYPAPLTIFVHNKSKTYGSPNPEFTFSYTGLVGGETVNELNLKATCNADISSKVGKYTISVNTGNVSNYETYSNLDGILEITKATLTVTAEDKTRTIGSANPEFTLTYQGFVNADNVASINTLPTASTQANTTSPIGEYPIIVSGGLSDNYTFIFINGKLQVKALAGDTNGDGKITDPEKAGDANGDGKITDPEKAGDTNGDGKITDPEKAGDTNGDGKITDPEKAGDTNGDGKITDPEKAGDTNGDGKITDPEKAGDTNGDGKITDPEKAGDTNGDGKITDPEKAGDTNGDGKITDPEKAGDTNGDGKITYPEIAGDTNGDGKITDPEKAGDTNGDGKITDPEKAGDTNGDGKITDPEKAGDTNGDGKITDPEKAGDTNGDGKITDPEKAGDTNGDGKITDPEKAGDTNGDGKITDPEKAGDTNGDGKITDPEKAGDTNGDGKITDPEKAGDTNGDGKITSPEILGDTNGDGKIGSGETTGDANGDGKITYPEVLGDKDGDGIADKGGIAGDTNGDGKITYPEIAGDTNGDGKITDPEKAGDTNGDGKITDPEKAGDTNGDGKITSPEIAGDTNGDGKITDPEKAGDTNGDGKIDGHEVNGDSNGDGKVTGGETTQTIIFLPLDNKHLGDKPFTVSAIGGYSGNPVTFTSSDITIATCSGTNGEIITMVGAGTCTITAHQGGNNIFSKADEVSQILKVDFNVGVEDNPIENKLIAYPVRNIEIRIKGEVRRGAVATLYDMSGRVIRIATLEEGLLNVMPTPGIKTAIYVLSVNDHGKIQTFKIPVRE